MARTTKTTKTAPRLDRETIAERANIERNTMRRRLHDNPRNDSATRREFKITAGALGILSNFFDEATTGRVGQLLAEQELELTTQLGNDPDASADANDIGRLQQQLAVAVLNRILA